MYLSLAINRCTYFVLFGCLNNVLAWEFSHAELIYINKKYGTLPGWPVLGQKMGGQLQFKNYRTLPWWLVSVQKITG